MNEKELPKAGIDLAVLILFFNRPKMLEQVFEQVRLARPSRLFLYQDGPRSDADLPMMQACRDVVAKVDWECDVQRLYQERNYGCDPSEYLSQKWAFSHVDKCVVLEDDDVPSQSFFPFCKEMLDRYENDTRIAMISGFNVDGETPGCPADYFLTSTFSIWGWASWKRVVDTWDEHYTFLDDPYAMGQLRLLAKERDWRNDMIPMWQNHRSAGKAFYESIFWASMLLSSQMAIMPAKNLINNIGLTTDSTHFSSSLKTTPHRIREMFTMPRHELSFPLRHPEPLQMVENVGYKDRLYRRNAWNHPLIKVGYSLEELCLNLRYGNFRAIGKAVKNRIKKTLGLKKHS